MLPFHVDYGKNQLNENHSHFSTGIEYEQGFELDHQFELELLNLIHQIPHGLNSYGGGRAGLIERFEDRDLSVFVGIECGVAKLEIYDENETYVRLSAPTKGVA